jgi:hypothetical protein
MDEQGMKNILLQVLDNQGYEAFLLQLHAFAKIDEKELSRTGEIIDVLF